MRQPSYFNIANIITIGRIAIIPILVLLMSFRMNRTFSFLSFAVCALAMSSDLVDGYLARRYGLTSTFGKFLDPLADKLLFLTATIMMIPLGRMPAWIVVVFLVRETMINTLRGIALDEGIVIAASKWGKYKSACLSAATLALLLHYPFFGVEWRVIGWFFLIPGFVFSVASGLHYSIVFFRRVRRERSVT